MDAGPIAAGHLHAGHIGATITHQYRDTGELREVSHNGANTVVHVAINGTDRVDKWTVGPDEQLVLVAPPGYDQQPAATLVQLPGYGEVAAGVAAHLVGAIAHPRQSDALQVHLDAWQQAADHVHAWLQASDSAP